MHRSAGKVPHRQFMPILLVVAATCAIQHFLTPGAVGSDDSAGIPAQVDFQGWGQPTLALFITGQQHGYIEPCGCAGLENQKGGLARRDQLLQQLRQQKKWPVAALDAGNQVRRTGPQAMIKFESTLQALRMMEYKTVGLGEDDLKLSANDLLSQIVAQLDDKDKSDLFACANVNLLDFIRGYQVIEQGNLRVGVTSLLGDKEAKSVPISDGLEISGAKPALVKVVDQMRADRCNFIVTLFNGSESECKQLAEEVPGVDLMVCADGIGEPKFQPDQIKRTDGTICAMIQTGGKGMYVGVVGLFFSDRPSFRYQRVALDKTFSDSRRMLDSLKQYQQTLEDVLKHQGVAHLGIQSVGHPTGKFVGSETCGECHTQAYAVWEDTGHAHATKSIAEPT
ncbi:MAG: hypothetical protein KDA92_19965, partial [Planctomycetales bacterium]|nr:hypothetical protein [Planctomycetales bacterium]